MFLPDEPITQRAQDTLGRLGFASHLADSIASWQSSNSLVLGLFGKWGAGKSSVLNLLESVLKEEHENVEIFRFDPWFFNSMEALLQAFLRILQEAAKSQPEGKDLGKLLNSYADALSFDLSADFNLGIIRFSIPVKKTLEGPEKLRHRISKSFKSFKKKVVIFIDNLDRLDAEELLLMLKLVRLCSNFPNTSYVLAFDRKQIEEILKKTGIEPAYLEKIIQVSVDLPGFDSQHIDEMFVSGLSSILESHKIEVDESFGEKFGPIFQKHIKPVLFTEVRSLKRFLNGLAYSLPLVLGEVNYTDLILLEFVRIFFPETYSELQKYKPVLTAYDSDYIGAADKWVTKERNEVLSKFGEWLKSTNSERDTHLAALDAILRLLFPAFNAFQGDTPSGMSRGTYAEKHERDLNIASPDHFDKYFRLQVSSRDIPMSQVNYIIEELNNGGQLPLTQFLVLKKQDRLEKVLSKIRLYVSNLEETGRSQLVRVLGEVSEMLEWGGVTRFGFNVESKTAAFLIMDILESLPDEADLQERITSLLATSNSLSFACYVSLLFTDETSNLWDVSKKVDLIKITKVIKNRIQNEVEERNLNILAAYPSSYFYILNAWRSDKLVNEPTKADEFLLKVLDANPSSVPNLLTSYLWVHSGTDIPADFEYGKFSQRYDVERIYKLLVDNQVKEGQNNRETFAIAEFMKAYEKSKEAIRSNNLA